MLQTVRELHALGFACHLIKPKSKAPVESKWTTGKRKTLDELFDQYQSGMNIGVRLGSASNVGGSFLAVIDCDVKSDDPEHIKEMKAKLRELHVPDTSPCVLSGRGNGSRHLYIRTEEPVKPRRFAQSSVKVKVHMPSVKASKHELEVMSEKDLAKGLRLRPAWEISIMGEGQQVVLPPSIHPDSGKPYVWRAKRMITDIDDIPIVELPDTNVDKSVESVDNSKHEKVRFEEIDLDLDTKLPDATKELIRSGEGCEDRSAGLFVAAMEMVKHGMSREEILSILTDRDYYLGEAAYEHAKTSNRNRAARWVERYTLNKAEREHSAESMFDDAVDIEEVPLTNEQAEKQEKEMIDQDWRKAIERTSIHDGAKPKTTLKNVHLILKHAVGEKLFKKDMFANSDLYGMNTEWGGVEGAEITDLDILRIKRWFINKWRCEPELKRIEEAVSLMASDNRFHPVRDYLAGLPEWDGVPRVDTWLKNYMNAEAREPYLSAVSRKTLVAMIARVMKPGCKFDHVLILEGHQGKGKSTAVRILSDPWFTDANFNITDKDAVVNMRSIWVTEIGELGAMSHADINQWKQFVTRQTDRIRLPYGKRAENFPRQCIFIGTTNAKEYLKDLTGNRRFWPVTVGKCDFEGLERDRDQLFAEALIYFDLGEALYLDDEDSAADSIREQSERTFEDAWVEIIGTFLSKNKKTFPEQFTLTELFGDDGPLVGTKLDRSNQMRAADALRALKFTKRKKRRKDCGTVWVWAADTEV